MVGIQIPAVQMLLINCPTSKCAASFLPPFKDLDVSFGEGQSFGKNFDDVKILHLEPFTGTFVEDVNLVLSLLGVSLVHNVSHEIVGGPLGILDLHFRLEHVPELDASDGKVDDRGILFDVERVLCESENRVRI